MRATTVFVLAIVVAIFAMSLEAATTTKKAATTTKKATTTTKKTTVKTTTKTTTKAATTTKATTTTPTTTTTSTTTTTTTTTPTTTTTSPPWCPVVDPGCPYVPLPSSDFTTPEEVETTETITAEWTTETETPSTEPEVKTSTASSGPWCPVPEPGCPYVPLPSTDITVEWSFETVSFSPEVPPTITVPEVEASTGGSTPCFCPVPEPGCPYVPLPSTDFTVEWSLETVSFSPEVPPTITLPEVEVSTGGGGSVPCWCPQPEPGCPYVPLPSSDFPGTPEGYTFPPGWTFEIETATFPEFSWPPDVSFSPELPPTITVPELPWCPVPEPGCPYVPLPSTGSPGWDDFTGTFSDYTVEPGICSICVAPLQFLAVNEGARSFSSIIFDKTVDGYQTLTLICPSNDAFSYSQIEFNAGGNGINNGITGSVAEATLVCNGTNWLLDAYVVTQVECDSTPPLELTTPQD